MVRCAVGTTESFKVKVGLHQGSALSPFLFAMIMNRLADEVRRKPPWTMLFADDIVICEETREEVERRLESWRYGLERRGIKVSRSKTEYFCINEGNDDKTVKMEDTKVPRGKEFKYLGSTVQESGGCEREVKKRVQAGWIFFVSEINAIGKRSSPNNFMELRIFVFSFGIIRFKTI